MRTGGSSHGSLGGGVPSLLLVCHHARARRWSWRALGFGRFDVIRSEARAPLGARRQLRSSPARLPLRTSGRTPTGATAQAAGTRATSERRSRGPTSSATSPTPLTGPRAGRPTMGSATRTLGSRRVLRFRGNRTRYGHVEPMEADFEMMVASFLAREPSSLGLPGQMCSNSTSGVPKLQNIGCGK